MRQKMKNNGQWTDASLIYYHKKTLQYLFDLDVLRFQEKPNDTVCSVEQTPGFLTKLNTNSSTIKKAESFEKIIRETSRHKGMTVRKNLMNDMIKLMSLEWAETSLSYYYKDTLQYLETLGAITHPQPIDAVSFSVEPTMFFKEVLTHAQSTNGNKMILLDSILQSHARKQGIRLSKKVRYDLIKMMGFIDKFGSHGRIWNEHN